jgi:DNA-binding protein YbaB
VAVYTLTSALCAAAPSVWTLSGVRFLQGVAGAAGIAIARAMVRDITAGRGMLRAITIEPGAFEGRDAELLSDLVLAAVAEAQRRAAELMQSEMRKVPTLPFPPAL